MSEKLTGYYYSALYLIKILLIHEKKSGIMKQPNDIQTSIGHEVSFFANKIYQSLP
jgi:hypothetical protein